MAEKPPYTRMTKTEAEALAGSIESLGLFATVIPFARPGDDDKGWGVVTEIDRDTIARDPMTGRYDWGPNWEYGAFPLPDMPTHTSIARAVVEQKVTTEVWARVHGRG